MQKIRKRDKLQTSFYFLKKLYIRQKQVICILVSIYFEGPPQRDTIKTNSMKPQATDPEICSILIF